VQGLLDAYNDVVKAIDGQAAAAVGTDGKVKTGAFTGDAATRQIRRSLSATIALRFDGAFQALAAIGVTTQRDGTLALDTAKFQQAVTADAPGVRQLVAGAGTGDGIADLLSKAAVAATRSTSGVIAVRQNAITAAMASAQKDIDRAQARLEVTERTLRVRFASLEPGVAAHGRGRCRASSTACPQQLVVSEVNGVNVNGQQFSVYQSVATTTADPARLVVLLFDGAITFLRQAEENLERGDVATFAARVARAQAIIAELTDSLDRGGAGDIGTNLVRLYDFMASHLTRGLISRDGGPVQEVIALLRELREGFEGARNTQGPRQARLAR
jgi:flagellar protein FliS